MLKGGVYINGLASITAQESFEKGISTAMERATSDGFKCVEPDYKQYFSPVALRRMSRILRYSILSAQQSLQDAGVDMPDAILTGTGLGCLEDSEKFLRSVIENNEEHLSPTSFIFSTHNTISGQIAMALKCTRTNNTFSNRYFSFESALLESMLMLKEGSSQNILVGSADEVIPMLKEVTQKLNLWVHPQTKGSILGEGACFTVISEKPTAQSYAKIAALKLAYKLPKDTFQQWVSTFLKELGLHTNEVDLIISGESAADPEAYTQLYETFANTAVAVYKPLIGEYFTASSYAYFLGGHILKNEQVPVHYLKPKSPQPQKLQNILIYNQNNGEYHSLALLVHV